MAVEKPSNPTGVRHLCLTAALAAGTVAVLVAVNRTGWLALEDVATVMLIATLAATTALFALMLLDRGLQPVERARVLAFIPLFAASAAFWAIVNQTFGALAVYADVRVDRTIGDWEVPAAWAQSLNPVFILALSAPLAAIRLRLGPRMPGAAAQIAAGTAVAGIGVLALLPFSGYAAGTVPILALVAAYGIITFGELHVGPVGMSAATTLAPAGYRTRFSALFFMSMAVGTALAGVLSRNYDPADAAGERSYFLALGVAAIAVAACVAALTRRINRVIPVSAP